MLILITWKLSHISEFTRVYSLSPTRRMLALYFMQIWVDFDFNEYVLMLEKCLLMQMRELNIWASFGDDSKREREGEGGKRHRKWRWGKLPLFFPKNIFLQSLESSWDYFHKNSHTCVTHLTFYMLSVRLSIEKLLHSLLS